MKKIISAMLAVLICVLTLGGCEKTPTEAESNGGSGVSESGEAEDGKNGSSEHGIAENSSENSASTVSENEELHYAPAIEPGEKGSIKAECADIREFVLSAQAKQLVLSMAGESFISAEPCAYYENIATFRIFDGNEAAFCTFQIDKGNEYLMEAILCRQSLRISGFEGEFYPTAEDGYPDEAFASKECTALLYEGYSPDFPAKAEYIITAVGGGPVCREEKEISEFCAAVESVRLFPIERFLTEADRNLLVSDAFSYYENDEDEKPYFTFYTDWVYAETPAGASRIYYPEEPEEYKSRIYAVYKAICDSRLENAQEP